LDPEDEVGAVEEEVEEDRGATAEGLLETVP
jgi:hypothetical protein